MSPVSRRSPVEIVGYLLLLILLVAEMIGGSNLGLGPTLGSRLADSIGVKSVLFYDYSSFYVRTSPGTYERVLTISPIVLPLTCAAAALGVLVCYLVMVFQLHRLIAVATDGEHPVTPGKAVWAHLVPLYSFYWVFAWSNRVADFLSASGGKSPAKRGWVGLILLAGFLLGWADAIIGLAVILPTVGHVRRKVVQVVSAPVVTAS